MTSAAEEHTVTGRKLLAKAESAVDQDDLLQASEKGWGAAAHVVKGYAQEKGRPHDDQRLLYQAVDRLAQETGDGQFRVLFSSASSLHSNFYENWMPKEMVAADLAQVREFLNKLDELS